jgi:rare lipoprotein A
MKTCFKLNRSILLMMILAIAACSSQPPVRPESPHQALGMASYYAGNLHGRKTASGETYHKDKLTAAHRFLPFGTRLKVINLENGREVQVRINDRGPFVQGRIVDLSYAAARELQMIDQGVVRVRVVQIP